MKGVISYFTIFSLSLWGVSVIAQNAQIDSLQDIIRSTKQDTTRVKTLNLLSREFYLAGNYAAAIKQAETALEFSKKLPYKDKALVFGARALNHIGNIYYSEGNLTGALQNYLEALAKIELVGDKKAIASSYHNIGNVYLSQENGEKAMENYQKSLKLKRAIGDVKSIANTLNSIGNVYATQDQYEEGIKTNKEALTLQQSVSDRRGAANSYNNLGAIYKEIGKQDTALVNYQKALKIYKETNNIESVALVTSNIGGIYYRQKKYGLAEEFLTKGLSMSKEIGALEPTKDALITLSEVCSKNRKHLQALKYYKEYIVVKDSLMNEENTKKTVRLEMNFEFGKKEAAAKLEHEKKEAVAEAEKHKQKIIIWSVCGILILVLGFAVYAYRSYLQKQKANEAITKQKEIIEGKQKEILDSIYYARRIQNALMPSEKYIYRNLNRLQDKNV